MQDILVKINEAALKFLEPLTPEETYATIVHEAIHLIKADYGSILLEQSGELNRVYGSHPLAYITKNRKKGNTYKSFKARKIITAHISEIGQHHPQIQEFGIKWTIFIPLHYENKSIGVLTLNSKRDIDFTTEEADVLKLYGSMATMAIRKTQLYTQTKKTLELRDFFIALAAHELKTPLTTINGYIGLLKNKLNKNHDTQEAKWSSELSKASSRLTKLVHELLALNSLKAGKIQYALTKCSMSTIIDDSIATVKQKNQEYEFINTNKLSNNEDGVIGDCEKLTQVIINLLENAAKFSLKNSKINVELSRSKDQISVSVIDEGKGIDKEEIPYIFDGFYKPDYNQEHGLGIGLFIAKKIIEDHNGSINIKSERKRGTIVQIKLPIAPI